ncbi:hypothetical protein NM688_g5179 [Phlebia brevispora]|uniref:Uncharacterized protein n=1 Tax=Phlebia brevispora TaxID=194682 RepID=A0ACC1SZ94_9APHY|nr:hypothetical protein NM688_g5179 [Phlebia brevispora]
MAPVRNARVVYASIPEHFPEPGKHIIYDDSQTIDLDNVPLNGGVLVKVLVFSNDPYLRERMRDPSDTSVSFVAPFQLNEPIENYSVGRVVRSESPEFKKGDYVYGALKCQEYVVVDPKVAMRTKQFMRLEVHPDIPLSVYVGACGMPGQTAYFGWREFADPQPGDVVFVTTAAGPVGSFVVQLAKASGLKVIASTGSEKKVEFVRSLGADVVFNYKTANTEDVLKKEGPINIFWDNVGGEVLGYALANAASRAKFIECGQMSGYNTGYPAIRNVEQIFVRGLKVYGFLAYNHTYYKPDFYREIPPKVARGEIKYREDIKHGLDKLPEAIFELQKGENEGKSVIIVAEA